MEDVNQKEPVSTYLFCVVVMECVLSLSVSRQTFLDQFQAAKDKIAEASAAAAESAKNAAQEFSQKATRVSLNINMKAPVVIVPRNSKSNNAIVVDLGKLDISNRFQIVGQRGPQGLPGVLDHMVIQLTSLKMARLV